MDEKQVGSVPEKEELNSATDPSFVNSDSDVEAPEPSPSDQWQEVSPEQVTPGSAERPESVEPFQEDLSEEIPEEPVQRRYLWVKIGAVMLAVLLLFTVMAGAGYYLLGQKTKQIITPPEELPVTGETDVNAPELELHQPPKVTEEPTLPEGELSTEVIAEQLKAVVVGIEAYFYKDGEKDYAGYGTGSGVVMQDDGYIITNAHVVLDEMTKEPAQELNVIFDQGEPVPAVLIGADSKTDLAVLKVEKTGLTAASFGDSSSIKVGEKALVIGNPTGFVLASSVTQGIISGVNRSVPVNQSGETMTLIQTDAAVNPGNSGGALVNRFGQVIGIISSKVSQVSYEGIGFAIPVNNVKTVVDEIVKRGYVSGRVRIGITYRVISEEFAEEMGVPSGLRVVEVADGTGADGIVQVGDIVMKMDGQEVRTVPEIAEILAAKKPGDTVDLELFRVENERKQALTVTVELVEDTTAAVGNSVPQDQETNG